MGSSSGEFVLVMGEEAGREQFCFTLCSQFTGFISKHT